VALMAKPIQAQGRRWRAITLAGKDAFTPSSRTSIATMAPKSSPRPTTWAVSRIGYAHADVLTNTATGVAANVDFLKGSGVELNEGVKVNDRLESSVEGIFAAGDCAEGPDFSTGGWSVHAIQPTATEHGRIAALNMAGQDAVYKGSLNMNVLDTAGLISSSFGEWQGVDGGDIAESSDSDHYRYTQLAFDGDRLVGALTLGRTENIGILRGLIQSRTSLGVWKDRLMEDPNRITEAYIANTH